jgi:vesicle-associated membrane protein 7
LTETQNKVEEVKGVMLNNIDKVIDRGDRLEKLEDDTADTAKLGERFKKGAKTFRNAMFARLCFYIILLIFVIFVNYFFKNRLLLLLLLLLLVDFLLLQDV